MMNHQRFAPSFHLRKIAVVLAALAVAATPLPAPAQNPFEAADPFSSEPAAPPPEAEEGEGAAPAPAGPEEAEAPAVVEKDPVVLAIRESNPTTPDQLLRAVRTLLNLDRPDEAKKYLEQLAAEKPDAQTLASLQQQFGSALLLRLIREERLAPEGRALGEAILAAARRAATDRDRLDALVVKLSDPKPEVRQRAMFDLRGMGAAAVAPLVAVLADPNRAPERPAVQEMLVRLGGAAVEPLRGALSAPDEALRTQVIETLGRIGDRRAAIDLLRPSLAADSSDALRGAATAALQQMFGRSPTPQEARQYLAERAGQFLKKSSAPRSDEGDDQIEVWDWDDEQKASVRRATPAEAAWLRAAVRAAEDLVSLAPENNDYRTLRLLTQLKLAKVRGGLDQPLPGGPSSARSRAAAAGADAVEAVLAEALRLGQYEAATGAAEVLGEVGDSNLLAGRGGRPRPLVDALRHGDRRLRRAAVEAILQIDPKRPFAGSSYVPEELGYFARWRGAPRALIGHPQAERVAALAAMLREIGYESDTARTGRELYGLAAEESDYDFVLLSASIDGPGVDTVIQTLRRDPHAAQLPISVIARELHVTEARRLAERDPLLVWMPPPRDTAAMGREASRLRRLAAAALPTRQERLRQASAALDHLARLAQSPEAYGFYDLARQQDAAEVALETPELAARAARLLGQLGTASAQQALVDLASRSACPLEDRRAAASAFALAVQRCGLGLERPQVLLQYERYNQSAASDRETQELLGSILDSIEAPTR